MVLLLAHNELSKVNRACDARGVTIIQAHSIYISVVGDAPHVLNFRSVCEEAHALQPPIPEGLVHSDRDLVASELVEDRP